LFESLKCLRQLGNGRLFEDVAQQDFNLEGFAQARDKLWTPDKETASTETKLWTPASKEPA